MGGPKYGDLRVEEKERKMETERKKKKKAKDLKIKENVYLVVDVELRFRNLEKIS